MFASIQKRLVVSVLPRIYWMLVIGLAGCAGASVNSQATNAPVNSNRPTTAYVYRFAVTAGDVTLNQGLVQKTYRNLTDDNPEATQLQAAETTAEALQTVMVQELQSIGFTATAVPRGMQVSGQNVLIVDGSSATSTRVTGCGGW